MPCILNTPLEGLSRMLWQARCFPTIHNRLARADARRRIHRNSLDIKSRGKGNKAWRRAEEQQKAWMQSGGFYVEDFITL